MMQNVAAPVPPLSTDDHSQILTFVESINREQLDGQTVRERLRQLQSALPDATLDIVSERENIGGDVTYCLLMSHGESVYSICCTRQHALPWQLRGATNADANELLTVNGYTVTVEHAIHLLDFVWEREDVATRMIDMALLAHEIDRRPTGLSDSELADMLSTFYSDRSLGTAEAQAEWRDSRGLTEQRLVRLLEEAIVRHQVERTLVEAQYDAEWRDHAPDYLGIRVMQATIPQYCLRQTEELLQKNSQGRSISCIVNQLAKGISYRYPFRIECADLLRHEIESNADDVFGQSEGAVLLVRMATSEVRLMEIVGHEAEMSDATLERRIVRRLMDQWYRNQRRVARIEWHWGRSA
jgi:putative peptide maturation system protein